MKKIYFVLGCLAALLGAVSCEKENPEILPEVFKGMYILNNGKWNANNASLTNYNPETQKVTQGVFLFRNNKKLGDLAQDILLYGNKMYITVANSGVVFVTDPQVNILKEIKMAEYKEPRNVISYKGKVYITYYDGYLAEIDTVDYAVRTVKVGISPEGLREANGKIYVANSGGANYPVYDKTVSVVDPVAMEVVKTLEVQINPGIMTVDNQEDVYVISVGDYGAISPILQRIKTDTDEVEKVTLQVKDGAGQDVTLSPMWMTMGADNKMYIVSGVNDAEGKVQGKVYTFNTETEEIEGEFVKDGTVIKNLHHITANPVSGELYIGSSDYLNNGDMYVFGADGKLKNKFETGLNPIKVCFLTNK